MGTECRGTSVEATLEELILRAIDNDVPRPLAEEIAKTTCVRLALDPWRPASARDVRRMEAYYWEVVRRRTIRGAAGSRAVARVVAEAVVADLRETGRDGAAIFDQLRRGWSERIPADLLEEYRISLCG